MVALRNIFVLWVILSGVTRAENAANPVGEPVLDPPTLHCLGAYWIVSGDENKNARVDMSYRKSGTETWTKGLPLFRVEKGAQEGVMMREGDRKARKTLLQIPRDARLFAGSAVLLSPDTDYEIRLSLSDPDGGAAERVLKCRTRAEPREPAALVQRHVMPGNGGGSGTEDDPFKGIAAAQKEARPGDLFLIHRGIYKGPFEFKRSGEPGKPIVWRGDADGNTVLDGLNLETAAPSPRVISAIDTHDIWFENLNIAHGERGIVLNGSARIVVRRCTIRDVQSGITATRNDNGALRELFIADNTITGTLPWVVPPDPKWRELWDAFEARGIEITGAGHEVCYNRVSRFKDAIDTFGSQNCSGIAIHHNDCSELIDDGCEMDYSERNTYCFLNRFTNVYQGISIQPVFGGPVYIFRNALYNVFHEPFKLHNSPSGALLFHNTSVKLGTPAVLASKDSPRNCVFRNNLFIGTGDSYAAEYSPTMTECDFDYDGFGGGPWKLFLKWNGVRYATLDEAKAKAPVYRQAVIVDAASAFASKLQVPGSQDTQFDAASIDLRLKEGSAAIDAGEAMPGFNDGFGGKAPDLGAYEFGSELPWYGPRVKN